MTKTIFFLLNMLLMGPQTPSQTTYINPMEGFILHSRSDQGNASNQMSQDTPTKQGDTKSDSDDSDDDFEPIMFPKIWTLQVDKLYKPTKKIGKEQDGELCSAFLPPILSPPDEKA